MHKFKKINLFFFIFLLISKNSFSLNNKNVNSNCFLIDKVDLTGNTLLDYRKKSKLISPYLQQCLTLNDMQEVAKSITNNYIEKGYVTSQAIIPEQDLSINGISSRLVDIIFPSSKGKILNL
jgi:hemolysin activation/secretion protein